MHSNSQLLLHRRTGLERWIHLRGNKRKKALIKETQLKNSIDGDALCLKVLLNTNWPQECDKYFLLNNKVVTRH